jgi:hypothetical protein
MMMMKMIDDEDVSDNGDGRCGRWVDGMLRVSKVGI